MNVVNAFYKNYNLPYILDYANAGQHDFAQTQPEALQRGFNYLYWGAAATLIVASGMLWRLSSAKKNTHGSSASNK